MTGHYILNENREVEKASVTEWSKWLEAAEEDRIVARTKFSDGWFVSTVFLGISYGEDHNGKPLVFKTMVFPSEDNMEERWMERCCTWEDAVRIHLKATNLTMSGALG